MPLPPTQFARLLQNALFAADTAAIDARRRNLAPAQVTRAAVARALEALEANGMIQFVPPADWPPYFVPDPPYRSEFEPHQIRREDAAKQAREV
jgi:hypothetical protein